MIYVSIGVNHEKTVDTDLPQQFNENPNAVFRAAATPEQCLIRKSRRHGRRIRDDLDIADDEVRAVLSEAESIGLDLNDLLDLAPYVEGSRYHAGRESFGNELFDLFNSQRAWLDDWVRDSAVALGLEAVIPNQTVIPVFVKADRLLVTSDREEAKAAKANGYDAVPVHREQTAIEGVPCYPNVKAINPKPECALILTPENGIIPALEDCLAAGVRLVWVFGISGSKDVSDDVLIWCELNHMKLIAGYCPYMFLPDMGIVHRFHGAVWKMIGYYPR